jgi:chromosome segregation ATPase
MNSGVTESRAKTFSLLAGLNITISEQEACELYEEIRGLILENWTLDDIYSLAFAAGNTKLQAFLVQNKSALKEIQEHWQKNVVSRDTTYDPSIIQKRNLETIRSAKSRSAPKLRDFGSDMEKKVKENPPNLCYH